jgi:hypothetical protein
MHTLNSVPLAVLLCASLLGFSQCVSARAIDINLNDDAAQLRYIAYDGRAGGFGKREMDIGLLFTTDNDYIGMLGAQVISEAGTDSPGLEAGIGFKVFAARSERRNVSANVFSLAIGGQLRFALPPHQRLQLGVEGYYSPRVVTFADADSFSYVTASIGYEILPRASVYIGYRDIRAKLDRGSIRGTRKIENGGHIGMRFEF